MSVDPGEYIVGCYLKKVLDCDFVDYNVRPPGGGMKGLSELDVVGLDLKTKKAYLCEVATHIRGMNYGNPQQTVDRILSKHTRQQSYAKEYLTEFSSIECMFWAPVMPVGFVTNELARVDTLRLMINGTYKRCLNELKDLAARETHDSGNIFFRFLQIMECVRDDRVIKSPQ